MGGTHPANNPYSCGMEKRLAARWIAGTAMDFEALNKAGSRIVMGSLGLQLPSGGRLRPRRSGRLHRHGRDLDHGQEAPADRPLRDRGRGAAARGPPPLLHLDRRDARHRGNVIEDAAVHRAVELSARKYCIVGASLASGDTSINHQVRITDENDERFCDCLTIGPKGKELAHHEEA